MVWCVFNSDGEYLRGLARTQPEHDPATEVVVQLPDYPDRRRQRWSGAALVDATQAQLDAYDAAEKSTQAGVEINTPFNRLLRDLFWNFEARLRLAGVEADDPRLPGNAQIPDLNSTNAGTRGAYTAELKALLEAKL